MLRELYKADLPAILEIEEAVHISPWTEETFQTCFQAGYKGWAIQSDNKLIGFIIISLREHECHILNVCVIHEFQHQGYGRLMMQHALSHAKLKGAGIAYLEVRKSNQHAIHLYRKLKFHLIGERKAYYPTPSGTNEDALIFAISLHDPET